MSQRRTIGLLGGSFNPAHAGHLHLSLNALKTLKLDEIWWLVSPQNPLKPTQGMEEYEARLKKARHMATHVRIRVLDIERTLGTRYSVDTIKALKADFPGTRFVWLMGADNLAQFHRWHRWQELAKLVPVAVFDRAPLTHTALRQKAPLAFARFRIQKSALGALAHSQPPSWGFVFMKKHPASGTNIRKSLEKRKV